MAITTYAIIDHVNSLTSADSKKMYDQVYAQAKADKLTAYTMKKACLMDSPYAREVTNKMKYRIRYQKNPTKVYFICDHVDESVEKILSIWTTRGIEVQVFEAHPLIAYSKDSALRRVAEVWGTPIGWLFSAPITRIQRENNLELYIKRHDHDMLVASGETHITKVSTRCESFITQQRATATDEEIACFVTDLQGRAKLAGGWIDTDPQSSTFCCFMDGDIYTMNALMEVDYEVCPKCRKPRRIRAGQPMCQYCSEELFDEEPIVTYYDDSFEESDYLD